jgi:hypothetical protein
MSHSTATVVSLCTLLAASAAAQTPATAARAEVLMLGTYHMANPGHYADYVAGKYQCRAISRLSVSRWLTPKPPLQGTVLSGSFWLSGRLLRGAADA